MTLISARAASAHGRAAEPHSARPGASDSQGPQPIRAASGSAHSRRRASVLALVPLVAVMLAVMTVLAVDWGRIQVIKAELQAAADAAALHAVTGVQAGTYESRAAASLADNRAGGKPIVLQSGDVVMGQWDVAAKKMIPNAQPADCLSITARTTVDLFFGGFVGVPKVSLSARATAGMGESIWGLTGIDSVELQDGTSIDSYQPTAGPYASTKRENATVSSNGPIKVAATASIGGDARPGVGYEATGNNITGRRKQQTLKRVFDPVTSAEWVGGYDNAPLGMNLNADGSFELTGNTYLVIPAGTYVVKDFKIAGTATLQASGPVTFYVTGAVDMAGTMKTAANNPSNMNIRVASSQEVKLIGTADFYGDVYAPEAPVRIGGTAGYFGKVLGKTLLLHGTVKIHHDERVDVLLGRGNFLAQ